MSKQYYNVKIGKNSEHSDGNLPPSIHPDEFSILPLQQRISILNALGVRVSIETM